MHIAKRESRIASFGHKTRRARLATVLGRSASSATGSTAAGREDTGLGGIQRKQTRQNNKAEQQGRKTTKRGHTHEVALVF